MKNVGEKGKTKEKKKERKKGKRKKEQKDGHISSVCSFDRSIIASLYLMIK